MEYQEYLTTNLLSSSDLNTEIIDEYLKDCPMAGLGAAFFQAEQEFGINALFLTCLAIHESNWGRSVIARDKKNLFGYMAYDNDPYGQAKVFETFEECIRIVAGFVFEEYLTPGGDWYEGPTLQGMNVHYATDPNWATAVAQHMVSMQKFKENLLPPNDYEGHWAKEWIEKAKSLGLMVGDPNGLFRPDDHLKRGEAAVLSVTIYNAVLKEIKG